MPLTWRDFTAWRGEREETLNQRDFCTVAQLGEFDAIIDARSPAEYAEDHIPGAISCPVLDNEERAKVGTLYTRDSPFAARKLGAVLVARNIAHHIETRFQDKPKGWKPLVYCWRGGQRSGAFTTVLQQVGWGAKRLEGGYKTWRHHVLAQLAVLPATLRFRVVAGPTGSGKSALLAILAARGAQVLDLERLAVHKGSLLGDLPDAEQPSQKAFETALYSTISSFDARRTVYVEAESRRIGTLTLPDSLIRSIRAAPCVRIEAAPEARAAFLLRDYRYLCDARRLDGQLSRLIELQGRETVAKWRAMAEAGEFEPLVRELLARHYDPLYARSQRKNFACYAAAPALVVEQIDSEGLARAAQSILASERHVDVESG